jgi:hypothetical protein
MSYLPEIIEISNVMIETLESDGFFTDFDIESDSYLRKRLCDELTQKFITSGLDYENGFFSEDEYEKILKEAIAEDTLRSLQRDGMIDSYQDENTEEVFFLTKLGKEELGEFNSETIKKRK